MNYISLNIKYLFDKQNLSEENFGKQFGLGRGAIQSYMIQKATPKIETIQKMTVMYGLTIDEFVNSDISKLIKSEPETKKLGFKDRILTVQEPLVELYLCPECVNKKRVIDAQVETIASLKEQIKLLEFCLGKNQRNGSE
jgi:transcriptional regulator with XRE-family HTH domain